MSRLVTYGCSFTMGEELADTAIFEKLTPDEVENMKGAWMSFPYREDYIHYIGDSWIKNGEVDMDRVISYSKELAWPAKLANLLGMQCVNNAIRGNCNEDMIHRLTVDYATGAITDTDIVIIATTTPIRFGVFSERVPGSSANLFTIHQNVPDMPGIPFSTEWQLQFHEDLFHPTYFMMHFYRNMKLVQQLLDEHPNLYWVEPIWDRETLIANKDVYAPEPLRGDMFDLYCDLIKHIDHTKLLAPSFCKLIKYWNEDMSPCSANVHNSYHPREWVHREFANWVYQCIGVVK